MASKASKRTRAAATAESRPVSPLWFAAAALIAALVVFSPALRAPFVFDDYHLPFADPKAAQMPWRFWIGGVRPLLMATYLGNYLFSGVRTFSYHAVNLTLHLIASAIAFLVLKELIRISRLSLSPVWCALAGSCVFLLHPLQTESVDYIAGRSEILCSLFVLAGWLVFLRHFEAKVTVSTAAAILGCGAAAVLSKESGVCLALLLAATDFYWRRENPAAWLRRRLILYVPLLVGLAAAVVAVLGGLGPSSTAGFHVSGPLSYALTECRVIVLYLRLFFFPAGQNVDWQIPLFSRLSDGNAPAFLVVIAVLGCAILLLYRRARSISFGLCVFLLALAPTSSFVPIRDAMAERRMYLPILGLTFALIGLADRVTVKPRRIAAAAVSAVAVLAALCYHRSLVWDGDMPLWEDAIAQNPKNARAHASLGSAMMLNHDCAAAAREFGVVVDLQGLDDIDGRNLGAAYECSGQPERALSTYRLLVGVHPESEAWTRIGYLEALSEHSDEALAAFDTAVRLDPNNTSAWAFRGVARVAVNDLSGAREDFHHALALDPANEIASSWLAKLALPVK
jgi:tetratricopeptide (TPR) repeat protein